MPLGGSSPPRDKLDLDGGLLLRVAEAKHGEGERVLIELEDDLVPIHGHRRLATRDVAEVHTGAGGATGHEVQVGQLVKVAFIVHEVDAGGGERE